MLHTISPQDMQEMERAFLDGTGYPSLLLMEHAAQAVTDEIESVAGKGAKVLFVCGRIYHRQDITQSGRYLALLAETIACLVVMRTLSLAYDGLVLLVVAFPATYILGIAYMMLTLHVELWQAMTMAMFSFIPGDIIKAVAAAFLGVRLNKVL